MISDIIVSKGRAALTRLGIKPRFYGIDEFARTPEFVSDKQKTDLHKLFYDNEGPIVHKWHHYLSIYDRYLSRYRNTPVRLLEIGVYRGGSLKLWREYFGPQATIVGIDIDPSCSKYDGQYGQVKIGSQGDEAFVASVLSGMGGFPDIIIDDGSHNVHDQIGTFNLLLPKMAHNGVYICEDVHTSYWRGHHEGGYRRRNTFIEYMKEIVDDLHYEFHGKGQSLPWAHKHIGAIHFYNSMVVIEKEQLGWIGHVKTGTTDQL